MPSASGREAQRMKWWKRSTRTVKRRANAANVGAGPLPSPHRIYQLIDEIPKNADDMTFMGPTSECLCGNTLMVILAWFTDRTVGGYFTEAKCALCGTALRVPTPIDEVPFHD